MNNSPKRGRSRIQPTMFKGVDEIIHRIVITGHLVEILTRTSQDIVVELEMQSALHGTRLRSYDSTSMGKPRQGLLKRAVTFFICLIKVILEEVVLVLVVVLFMGLPFCMMLINNYLIVVVILVILDISIVCKVVNLGIISVVLIVSFTLGFVRNEMDAMVVDRLFIVMGIVLSNFLVI